MAPIPESGAGTVMLSLVCTGGILTTIVMLLFCAKKEPKSKRMTKVRDADETRTKPGKHRANKSDSKQTTQSSAYLADDVPVDRSASRRRQHVMTPAAVGKLSFRATDVLRMAIRNKQIFNQLVIDESRVQLEYIIGSGNFGLVYKGTLLGDKMTQNRPVAVKTVQGPSCTRENAQMFIQESARMAGFTHDNILALIGITVKDEKPCIVLPYMENGDLHSYIVDRNRKLTMGTLTRFGYDVAKGMDYLSNKKFIHRDLAARNCMVSGDLKVKVGDFGLSRDLYESDYYRMTDSSTPLPFRWLAIESIVTSKFTIKSDVWSFGVLFWELMTRGLNPYSDIKDSVQVFTFIKGGGRLTFPSYVSRDLSDFMQKCWHQNPQKRPEFREICSVLRNCLANVL